MVRPIIYSRSQNYLLKTLVNILTQMTMLFETSSEARVQTAGFISTSFAPHHTVRTCLVLSSHTAALLDTSDHTATPHP